MEAKLSSKILQQAREQQDAIDAEQRSDLPDEWEDAPVPRVGKKGHAAAAVGGSDDDDDDDDVEDVQDGDGAHFDDTQHHFYQELVR